METKTLSSAIKKIAISYIFIYFSINIVVFDILPDWLGYFMIVSALPILSENDQSAQLLRPFGVALGIWNIIEWALKITGTQWNFTLISLILSIITIYLHFQLITNIANLDIEQPKRKRLLLLRTIIVILHTILNLWLFIPKNLFDEEIYAYIIMFMSVPQAILCFWIAGELFELSKKMKEKEFEVSEITESIEKLSESETDIE